MPVRWSRLATTMQLRDFLVRLAVFRVYLPARALAHALRSLSRRTRVRLGLRQERGRRGTLPTRHWSTVCSARNVVFVETKAVDGNVSLADLAVINAVCRTYGPREIFEIGTFDGRTTLNLARNSEARVTTLDLPPDHETVYDLQESDRKYVAKPVSGRRFRDAPNSELPCVRRIRTEFGDSASFDFQPWHGQVDLVFVDGAHSYDYVLDDSRAALKLLPETGGVIIWHDYGTWPDVAPALEAFRRENPDLHLVHIRDTNLAISIGPRLICSGR